MDMNLTMLGRILHAVANELAAMEQEAADKEPVCVAETVLQPVEEDMSRFQAIEDAAPLQNMEQFAQTNEQAPAQPPVKEETAPVTQQSVDDRIAQLEAQLREERRQNSMANFNFQPINIGNK
jgi:hypothetical protein